jgi:GNAT superfamily N-acetyltransferase
MFLVPAARGRGLGPDSARTLVSYLLQEPGRERLTADPYLWNEPTIRAWRKAGFRPIEERAPDAQHCGLAADGHRREDPVTRVSEESASSTSLPRELTVHNGDIVLAGSLWVP